MTKNAAAEPTADGVARRPGAAIFALTMAGVAQAADVSLHNTAIASAASDLGMSPSERAFAASVATLAMAASILAIGNLGDRIGRRLVLLWACGALLVGGLVTAVAPSAEVYIGGRVLTGFGLAGTLCLSMALIRTVAPDRVGKALSLFFTGQVAFTIPLTILGGWLIGGSWRYGYLVVPVVGIIAFVLNKRFVPRSKAVHARSTDGVGLSLIAVALVGIIWGVSDASGGWTSARVLVPLLIGVAALVAFLWWETHHDEPALPVKLFKDPDLAGALTADVSFNMWQAVMVLQLSLLWQYVYSYDALQVTVGQLPATIAMVLGAFAAGRLATRGQSAQSMVLVGLAGVAIAMGVFALAGGSSPYWVFGLGLVVGGFSRMLTETAAGEFFVGKPPADLVGATVASKPAIGQASFALGLALSSSLLYGGFGNGLQDVYDEVGLTPVQQTQISGYVAGGEAPGWVADSPQADEIVQGATDAYVTAYQTTTGVFAVVFVLLFLVAAWFLAILPRRRARAGLAPDGSAGPTDSSASGAAGA
ncbi:MFS transporter [Paraoerskovia marina]|uniref:MFS transporter n=1 Tax=Paraoerskovia marina TaxID=545619 RepID=UPI0004926B6F|nr:MFS transporter [Paraoerskovia marina]